MGGQRGLRNIWHRYYDDCHAVVFVLDAEDHERLAEGWEVFGKALFPSCRRLFTLTVRVLDSVLSAPQILGVPLLLLANKQDSPLSLSVEEIRHDYEDWHQRKLESARRMRYGEDASVRRERIASLDVLGISAIEGLVVVTLCLLMAYGFSLFSELASKPLLTGCSYGFRIVDGKNYCHAAMHLIPLREGQINS